YRRCHASLTLITAGGGVRSNPQSTRGLSRMAGATFRPSLLSMRKTFPVIWSLHGETHTGKLDVTKERIELTSRGYTFAFPRDSVIHFVVERGVEARIRGLTSIKIRL